jgi:hypothetical protein
MVSKTIKIYYQRQHDTLKEYWSGVKISTPSIVSGMLLFTIGNATVKTVYKKSTSKCTRCMFIIIFFENFTLVGIFEGEKKNMLSFYKRLWLKRSL